MVSMIKSYFLHILKNKKMKKLKLNLQQFEGAELLTRSQLKKVLGGDGGSDELCMGCETDAECSAVLKGTCKEYPNCNGGVKCCTGWTSC